MPKNKNALIRYRVIDEILRQTPPTYPKLEQIRERVAERIGDVVSASTIEKDLHSMKTDPRISDGNLAPIEFDDFRRGYFYAEPGYSFFKFPLDRKDLEALRMAATTLHQLRHSEYLDRFRAAIDKIRSRLDLGPESADTPLENFIQYEHAPVPSGTKLIEPLYKAIREKQEITFQYNNIYKDTITQRYADPLLLKEYHNRWFLITYDNKKKDFITFALDRMSELNTTGKKFERFGGFDPDFFFKHCIGITEYDHKPEKVALSFSPVFGKLVLLQPIHSSQKVLKNNDKEIKIEIEVLLTPELSAMILGFRDQVKVMGPARLKKQIVEDVKKIAKRYH